MTAYYDEFQLLVLGAVLVFVLLCGWWRGSYAQEAGRRNSEAEGRAEALLQELLSEPERQQLTRSGYISVPSPGTSGRSYRVPAQPGWVEVYDEERLSMRLCVEPLERLPAADVVLMHKLMIEGNEERYLREANVVYLRTARRRSRVGCP